MRSLFLWEVSRDPLLLWWGVKNQGVKNLSFSNPLSLVGKGGVNFFIGRGVEAPWRPSIKMGPQFVGIAVEACRIKKFSPVAPIGTESNHFRINKNSPIKKFLTTKKIPLLEISFFQFIVTKLEFYYILLCGN